MSRAWYATPTRVRPGFFIPGRFNGEYWEGPQPDGTHAYGGMHRVRGPFPTAKEAAEAARAWREDEGKHSDVWLALTVDGEVTHTALYDPDRTRYESGTHAVDEALVKAMEGAWTGPPIVRRGTLPWSPYGDQMVRIPLSSSGKRGIAGSLLDIVMHKYKDPKFDLDHAYRDTPPNGACEHLAAWVDGKCATCGATVPTDE